MKTFEVWSTSSNPKIGNHAFHILEAETFTFLNGVFLFYDEKSNCIHSIVSTPGMLIRNVQSKV